MKLSNSQYDQIMRMYDVKQNKARNTALLHQKEVITKYPEYKKLCDEITTLSANAARSAIMGNFEDKKALSEKIADISYEKKMLLKTAGYPENYLEPDYECKLCNDTGMLNGKRCTCFNQAAIDLLYNQSNIKKILLLENFSNFNYDWYSESDIDPATNMSALDNIRKVRENAEAFIDDFPSGKNLLLYGPTGVGKTFLTHCIAKELLDKGHSVLYLSAIDLFELFSKYSFDNDSKEEYRQAFSQILDCELLIIDDLGTELANSFTNSKLFYCINERAVSNLSTILSTNLNLQEIMNLYSERIFSRLANSYKILKIFGEDIRLKRL